MSDFLDERANQDTSVCVYSTAEISCLRASAAELKAALREMIYETTHLSPQEEDGSHWCKISKHTLAKARAAVREGKP